jgi:hypothetical protein
MRCWGFERWTGHVLYLICFWLSVWAAGSCDHLARPCVVFHRWVSKTCGMLFNQSRDAWSESWCWPESWCRPESGSAAGVVTSIEVGKCDRSWDKRLESYLPTRVGHTARVLFSDRSRAYAWSYVFRPELGIWLELSIRPESGIKPKSCIWPESRICLESRLPNRSSAYDQSREIPALLACIMGNIWYENSFIALNTIKKLVDFLLRTIRCIIHSIGLDSSP